MSPPLSLIGPIRVEMLMQTADHWKYDADRMEYLASNCMYNYPQFTVYCPHFFSSIRSKLSVSCFLLKIIHPPYTLKW